MTKTDIIIFYCTFLCVFFDPFIDGTPLDDYVNEPDDHYRYDILKEEQFFDYKLYYINMTSQKWQNGKKLILPSR